MPAVTDGAQTVVQTALGGFFSSPLFNKLSAAAFKVRASGTDAAATAVVTSLPLPVVCEADTIHRLPHPVQACDADASGRIDSRELHLGIALLYGRINNRMPLNLPTPTKREIEEVLKRHDADGSGSLDEAEFRSVARELLAGDGKPSRSLPFRAVRSLVTTLGLVPALALAVSKGALNAVPGLGGLQGLPPAVIAGIITSAKQWGFGGQ